MSKQIIRKKIKEKLASIPASDLNTESVSICQKIINSKDYKTCTTLLAYMPLQDEVDISPVISDALNNHKEVFLPRIIPGTNQMEFYGYETASQAKKGSFGIMEPAADEERNFFRYLNNAKDKQKILMLVPGRAFTKDGRRLGRGKGFYDIYFSRLAEYSFYKDIKKSGVCLACQLLADLPVTPDDVVMDSVVSTGSTTDLTISGE